MNLIIRLHFLLSSSCIVWLITYVLSFYFLTESLSDEEVVVSRQAYAGFNYRSDLRAVGEKQLTAVLLDMSKVFDSFHYCSGSNAMKYTSLSPGIISPEYPPWLRGKKSMLL